MSNEILNECASAVITWPVVALAAITGVCFCVLFWAMARV